MQVFMSMLVFFLAVFGLIEGGLAVWQGVGRTKTVGIALLILGILCLGFFVDGTWGTFGVLERWGTDPVWTGISGFVGALIGFAVPTVILTIVAIFA